MQNIVERFERRFCDVCGSCDISQFFKINDSYIAYDGAFHSFREILIELQILHVQMQIGNFRRIT